MIDSYEKTFSAKGAASAKDLARIVNDLTGIYKGMKSGHPFIKSGGADFYANLQERMTVIHAGEVAALALLQKAVPAK